RPGAGRRSSISATNSRSSPPRTARSSGSCCSTTGAESALVQQLLGSVHEREAIRDPREAQESLHLLGSPDERESEAGLFRSLVCLDKDAQPGGIHELQRTQI